MPPRDAADAQPVVGCGRALAGEEIAIVDPESRERLAGRRESARSGWPARASRRATGAIRTTTAGDVPARGSPGEDEPRRACAPAISASSTRRRAVHHRPHQGPDHHPRPQPLPAGHRGHGAGEPSGAAPAWRRRLLGGRRRARERLVIVQEVERTERNRDRRRTAGPAESARRSSPSTTSCRSDIVLLRPGRAAKDDERQDPASACPPTLAGPASSTGSKPRRICAGPRDRARSRRSAAAAENDRENLASPLPCATRHGAGTRRPAARRVRWTRVAERPVCRHLGNRRAPSDHVSRQHGRAAARRRPADRAECGDAAPASSASAMRRQSRDALLALAAAAARSAQPLGATAGAAGISGGRARLRRGRHDLRAARRPRSGRDPPRCRCRRRRAAVAAPSSQLRWKRGSKAASGSRR